MMKALRLLACTFIATILFIVAWRVIMPMPPDVTWWKILAGWTVNHIAAIILVRGAFDS